MVDMVDTCFCGAILQDYIAIAENIMAVAATKQGERPLEFAVPQDHAKTPSGQLKVGIAEAFHLEGDYLLVKIPAGAIDASVPQIPRRKVRELLNKYANKVVAGATKVPLPSAPLRSLSINSATSKGDEFMENMAETEMAVRVARINKGELITAAELAERLSLSKQAISRAASTGRMFTVEVPSGKKVFPAFYADPQFDRTVLERVSKELGQLPGPSKWQFFTTGKVSLDGNSPLEAISDGQVNRVLAAAIAFREH